MINGGFNPDEREFRHEIASALAANRASAGECPRPELLMAACAGVPFDGAEAVERHRAVCPICDQLSRDLAEMEFPPASQAEDRRIRARWEADGRRGWGWVRRWRPVAAVAALGAVAAVLLLVRTTHAPAPANRIAQTAPPAAPVTPPPAPAANGFVLAKAAIKVPAAAVLTFRGAGEDGQKYLADLSAALEPYRQEDYANAARRLGELSLKYPRAAEPPFYRGVAQLFLGQNEAAIESLEAVRKTANSLREDASWYLAVAFDRAGRSADARREAEGLCAGGSEYRAQACAAVGALRPGALPPGQ